MKTSVCSALFLFAFAFSGLAAFAEPIYYVETDGNDETGDGSSANPFATISNAFEHANAAGAGTVRVGEGTFYLPTEVSLSNAVSIVGSGRDKTLVMQKADGRGNAACFTLDHAEACVRDLCVSNVYMEVHALNTKKGIAVIRSNGGTVRDCRFVACEAGGASSSATFGIYGGTFSGCEFINCQPKNQSGTKALVIAGGGTVENCLFIGTKYLKNGTIYVDGGVKIRHCTVVKSSGDANCSGAALYIKSYTNGQTEIVNSVFAASTCSGTAGEGTPEWSGTSWSANLDSCFSNCAWGVGARLLGANAVTASAADFRNLDACNAQPLIGTPLVDGGRLYEGMPTKDLAGHVRPNGDLPDIGCYEYFATDPECAFSVSQASGTNDTYGVTGSAAGVANPTYRWTIHNESLSETDEVVYGQTADLTFKTSGVRTIRLDVLDANNVVQASFSRPSCVTVVPQVVYAAPPETAGVEGAYPYDTPQTAYQGDVGAFVSSAVDGQTVRLSSGTFKTDTTLEISRNVKVYGAGRSLTILRPTGSTGVRKIWLKHADAEVAHLMIADNPSPWLNDGGTVFVDNGGGTFSDCIVTNCGGANGSSGATAAVYGSNGRITHCEFVGCTANKSSGTSIIWVKHGELDNCLIQHGTTFKAGAVRIIDTDARVRNCTFVANTAHADGKCGGLYWDVDSTAPQVVNCIFALNKASGDTSTYAPEFYRNKGGESVTNCLDHCAWGLDAALGPGGITVDKTVFVGSDERNYRLVSGAKPVNAGVEYPELSETDLDGNPRNQGKGVDIGCYETDASKPTCGIQLSPSECFRGASVTFTSVLNDTPDGATCRWTVTNVSVGAAVDFTHEGNATFSKTLATAGWRSVRLEVWDSTGENLVCAATNDLLHVAAPDVYLAIPNAPGVASVYPHDTPETACTNGFNSCWADTIPGSVLHVGAGTFDVGVGKTYMVDGGRKIIGAGRDQTVLTRPTGWGISHPQFIEINHAASLVSSLTISNVWGDANAPSIVKIGAYGGTFEDACVRNCYNGNGSSAAIIGSDSDAAMFRRVIVCGNRTEKPSGASPVWATSGIYESLLVYANMNGTAGGAIRLYGSGSPKIRNCTFACNVSGNNGQASSGIGGLVVYDNGQPSAVLENCVFVGNTATSTAKGAPEWYATDAQLAMLAITNCVWGVDTDAKALGVDPLRLGYDAAALATIFRKSAAGDFRLRSSSPLVDRGRYADWMATATDLGGKPRATGRKTVDIGCYQANHNGLMLLVR